MRVALTPQQLKAFLMVAELKNFRLAADACHVSQPALSRTVKVIEEVLGTSLFDRNTRRVELTAAGCELVPIARRIVGEFDDAFSELNQFVEGRSGRVTIAMLPSVGVGLLPAAIASFKARYPAVAFHLRGLSAGPLLQAIDQGTADLGISVPPPAESRFAYQHLLTDEFVLVCRRDDALARLEAISWSTLQNHPVILASAASSIRPMTDAAFVRAGLSIQPAYECDGELSICGALIAQGLGVMAVPRLALRLMDCTGLATVPLRRPVMRRRIGLITRAERTLSTAALNFQAHLLACAAHGWQAAGSARRRSA